MLNKIYLVILIAVCALGKLCSGQQFESRTKFIFYGQDDEEKFVSTSANDSLAFDITGCRSSHKYAIIVHGWRESCNSPWAKTLRSNLQLYRGGCIICMDYSAYNNDYGYLMGNYKAIAQVLTDKLNALRNHSFRARDAYLFGFSFGSRLIAKAGIDFGPKEIGNIDLCEPAGPGFENTKTNADPKLAAQNAQCIHTAMGGYGTREKICHQNWMMGNCGESQIGARPFPNGNHGLCPQFYNYAFTNIFPAVTKNVACAQPITDRDAAEWPSEGIRMGYFQTIDPLLNLTEKNFYAITTRDPPFN